MRLKGNATTGITMGTWKARLNREHKFAGGGAAFEIAMGMGGIGKRVDFVNPERKLFGGDPAEDIAGAPIQLVAGGDVVSEIGASEKQRSFLAEDQRLHGGNRAAGVAETDHHSARLQ